MARMKKRSITHGRGPANKPDGSVATRPDVIPVPIIHARTVLDGKLILDFCKMIRRGLPADAVCDYIGVNAGTFHSWVVKGRKYLEGDREPKEHAIFGSFVQEYRKATARYRDRLGRRLHAKSNRHWYRELSILERRDRKSFGRYEPSGGGDESLDPDEQFM